MNWTEILLIAVLVLCPVMMILGCGRMFFGGTGGSYGRDEPKNEDQHRKLK